MKSIRTFLAAFAFIGIGAAVAQSPALLQQFNPGFAMPDGSKLNLMVGAINGGMSCPSYQPDGTPAATDKVFFIATRSYQVISASEVHTVAAGGTSVLQVVKDTGTDAPGAGTDLLTTGFDLNGTANTVQIGALSTTVATKQLVAGNRLAVDYANTIQSTAGVVVTVCLSPIQ